MHFREVMKFCALYVAESIACVCLSTQP